MARALIVGCGARGTALGAGLAQDGWIIRGTSRSEAGAERIDASGFEGAVADPAWPGTILDLVGDVALLYWLLGTAIGGREDVEAIHGPRLESLLERLVDTPVRGIVYEAAGTVDAEILAAGEAAVRRAAETWRIPAEIITDEPGSEAWMGAARGAAGRLLG